MLDTADTTVIITLFSTLQASLDLILQKLLTLTP